ncbi:MAG: carbamoyltransferase [bacterium]|nr:carbamoyltransferase [bacterium]
MNILGLSCFFHDSAACLVQDGKVVAAVEEERFIRAKNTSTFPIHAINYCVQEANISFNDIDYVFLYEKPYLKFSRVIIDHLKSFPFSLKRFLDSMPAWLDDRLSVPLLLKKELGYEGEVLFVKHHMSHAASAFLVSPFEEAAILTADGVGEWATTACGYGRGNDIKILKEIHYPHSLGLLYSAVTTFLGFEANRGEGTVMGLSSYGEPVYIDQFRKIIEVKPDGSYKLDTSYFNFIEGRRLFSKKFVKTFGEPRKARSTIEKRHEDIAASLQMIVEEIIVKMAGHIYEETKMENLCLAGGVFLNCVANHKILEQTPFKNIYVQPAAGDTGGALGVAVYANNVIFNNPRNFVMDHPYHGPAITEDIARRSLVNSPELKSEKYTEEKLVKFVAKKLAENKTIGWAQGRMEFGPRALGNRSILGNPCSPDMKDILNLKIKFRESFRPFAPAVLEENANDFFELKTASPFMTLAARVKKEKQKLVPAITHVDGTARIQTVNKKTNPRFWKVIKEFEKISGVPMVINTSLNLKGDPIVCTPDDAIDCFNRCEMDYMVIGDYVVEKRAQ